MSIEPYQRLLAKLRLEVSKIGLELNEAKTKTGILGKDAFDFLGYKLKTNGRISVKEKSEHKKVTSLVAKISHADHKKKEFLRIHRKVTFKAYKQVLIDDINEQITGAVSEKKKYGWLFYFSQIDDMALLFRLDRIVDKLCKQCKTFNYKKPAKIKSFIVAFREIHKVTNGTCSEYIPSYDNWTTKQKISFLLDRGIIQTEKSSLPDINRLFEIEKRKRLINLEKDIKDLS